MSSRWYYKEDNEKHVIREALKKIGIANADICISSRNEEWGGCYIEIKDIYGKSHVRHYWNIKEALHYIKKREQFKDIKVTTQERKEKTI